jgi:hypothetical protein
MKYQPTQENFSASLVRDIRPFAVLKPFLDISGPNKLHEPNK